MNLTHNSTVMVFFIGSDLIGGEGKENRYFGSEIRELERCSPSWVAGGFGNPEYFADFEYWGKMSKYTLDEALLLSVGIEPKHVDEARLDRTAREIDSGRLLYPAFEFLVRRRELFRRHFPTGFSGWLSISQYSLKSWIDEIELDVHAGFYKELEKMHPKIKPKKEFIASGEKSLSAREKETLLILVATMAIKGYTYDPNKPKNSCTSDIRSDLKLLGFSMDDKTILKWLQSCEPCR
jgi:hypothetical protein